MITRYGDGLGAPLRFAIVLAVVLPVVCLLSFLTYRLIEMPGQQLGRVVLRRFARKEPALEPSPAE
ncbi:hypothetical protein EOA27_13355 [Mesorhizobium sp. M2A.F.Ca.ET.037.01.1.1]|nr:hypothetical protein EOA27_13355 [Mesorhizobium sp. M2A.F.Ca.ET.037.01.1.1]